MILCLLPAADYDPTESGVPWFAMTKAGFDVKFATPDGQIAWADKRLVETGFGVLNPFFMTRKADLVHYQHMTQSPAFQQPLSYNDVKPELFTALLVPGGHAIGMRSLLESTVARTIVQHFFALDKPVAAVCHGVLLLARTIDPSTGRSVLFKRKTTALTASMEYAAWWTTAPFLGRYYRTYDQSVEAEVTAALANAKQFSRGPLLPRRDRENDVRAGFIVRDRNYLSARWPGDCHRFAEAFIEALLTYQNGSLAQHTPQRDTALHAM